MKINRVPFILALGTLLATVLPDPVAAVEEVPVCHPTQSSTLCYYAYDPQNCFVDEEGIRRCRTIGIYRWEQGPL